MRQLRQPKPPRSYLKQSQSLMTAETVVEGPTNQPSTTLQRTRAELQACIVKRPTDTSETRPERPPLGIG